MKQTIDQYFGYSSASPELSGEAYAAIVSMIDAEDSSLSSDPQSAEQYRNVTVTPGNSKTSGVDRIATEGESKERVVDNTTKEE
jgi:hypothetical protein